MKERKPDRRRAKTQTLLQETLVLLMGETDYNKITVRQICERADVGRTTFYAHYQDKDDLLEKMFAQFIAELHTTHPITPPTTSIPPEWIYDIFQHVAEVPPHIRSLITQPQMRQRFHTQIIATIATPEKTLEEKIRLEFLIGGIMSTLTWWVKSGMSIPPATAATLTAQQVTTPQKN